MSSDLNRRVFLSGLGASLPGMAGAQSVLRSGRPMARGDSLVPKPQPLDEIFAKSRLGNRCGFVVMDAGTGEVLEAHRAGVAQPPASVAKIFTALYGLDKLGAGHRFQTRILADGSVQNGRLRGDLYLVGGGDPTLDTDRLAELAVQVTKAGIFGVDGRFFVVGSALPYVREIDDTQPEHVGYNPAISGLNLNFNRVHFQWERGSQGYHTSLTARALKYDPPVSSVDMTIVDRDVPVFRYGKLEGRDSWSVARSALGRRGARWLPVRDPVAYGGDVFRWLGAQVNLRLPSAREARVAKGRVVAEIASDPLEAQVRDLLKYSTNLTAEVVGLRASGAGSIASSARAMSDWSSERLRSRGVDMVNHSGLSTQSRVSANEMGRSLLAAQRDGVLFDLLKDVPLAQSAGAKQRYPGVEVRAKTGTLNFTRGLAGYVQGSDRRLVFAIFASDLAARGTAKGRVSETPKGARGWSRRAVGQEQALLRRWAVAYL